jgi:cytochrome c oxidase subunit 2
MLPDSDLQPGDFRLLEVDNQLIVPAKTHIRLVITSADVIHCWAVPSLGIKVDAIPGRLNQVSFITSRNGLFYGHCNEICGINHAFMPIVVKAVGIEEYCAHINSISNNN